jgi:hypothetical protein
MGILDDIAANASKEADKFIAKQQQQIAQKKAQNKQ